MNKVSPDRIRLSVAEAQELAEASLRGIGYDAEEARIIADHVVDAALCGYEYSGLPKILNVAEDWRFKEPRGPLKVLRETPVSTLYDGGNNVGMFAIHRCTETAIAKARAQGIGLVGVTNSWMSGRSALFVEMIARAGLVGMLTIKATSIVAPPGAARGAVGTNPIAFGFPADPEPVVVDFGTSAFMSTDLTFRVRRGELLPEGVAIDEHGRPTRDPTAARRGAILSFGGHKGFALGFAIHALGALTGADMQSGKSFGYLIMAIKPDLLVPLADFKRDLATMIASIKATPRQPGVDEIRLPSERAFRERARNRREGIEIDRAIYDALLALKK
ncbi:MAG TPA: Ldh family oxidoreductase [Burkholderiales bacterium]|nr:Ldh family oxidoreductase [Burkholderiales bacterium]